MLKHLNSKEATEMPSPRGDPVSTDRLASVSLPAPYCARACGCAQTAANAFCASAFSRFCLRRERSASESETETETESASETVG
ncbi:hypothetical protein AAFF_G00303200 [Aldrovandia affinis]|uniref:Uncharacterized protein n=1 Tax=Aldrovandia affinis TaxID=143900 RepID=A0AAD7R8H1_9TELE|nr:hypothetical protein AAFF_G00303200 [Aldrovandia affinis]